MISPSIGRKVWYHPSVKPMEGQSSLVTMEGQACDATVVAVHDDRTVNLVVWDSRGTQAFFPAVQLLQDDDEAPEEGHYAEWMPYQTAQAAAVTK